MASKNQMASKPNQYLWHQTKDIYFNADAIKLQVKFQTKTIKT